MSGQDYREAETQNRGPRLPSKPPRGANSWPETYKVDRAEPDSEQQSGGGGEGGLASVGWLTPWLRAQELEEIPNADLPLTLAEVQ